MTSTGIKYKSYTKHLNAVKNILIISSKDYSRIFYSIHILSTEKRNYFIYVYKKLNLYSYDCIWDIYFFKLVHIIVVQPANFPLAG